MTDNSADTHVQGMRPPLRVGQAGAGERGWSTLFYGAFTRSRTAMVLLDGERRHVEVNGAYLQLVGYRRGALIGRPFHELLPGGPLATEGEWRELLNHDQFTDVADIRRADGTGVRVEFAGHPAIVAGRQLVLFVVLTVAPGNRRPLVLPAQAVTSRTPLTARELEVVRLTGLGLTGPEIAHELHVSHNTVRGHIRNSMGKTGARSRAQLVAQTLAEGLWGLEPPNTTVAP